MLFVLINCVYFFLRLTSYLQLIFQAVQWFMLWYSISVQAGLQTDYAVDGRNIQIRKWSFSDQDVINDAGVVGLELKNTYDHLLAASTYGGYDTW